MKANEGDRMPTYSAYSTTLASGEVVSVLVEHGHHSPDMGAELAELLGAGFRSMDRGRVELPAIHAAVSEGNHMTTDELVAAFVALHGFEPTDEDEDEMLRLSETRFGA